jgi:hypothetical protein
VIGLPRPEASSSCRSSLVRDQHAFIILQAPYIATLARHSLIVECGPTPWGLVRHDIVTMMQVQRGERREIERERERERDI